jgi:hypothetical protein
MGEVNLGRRQGTYLRRINYQISFVHRILRILNNNN